jgi:hypothetical protein
MPSAVSQRQRRKTAGTRMTELVGKAQDDDDAFWGHDTWGDEDGSGNESFHESDEDSAAKKDTFDSDFDISESDHDEEEAAAGEEEERELHRVERSNKQKKSHYVDVAKGGRALMQKQKGKAARGTKRVMGDGINAGLVLNSPASGMWLAAASAASSTAPLAPIQKIQQLQQQQQPLPSTLPPAKVAPDTRTSHHPSSKKLKSSPSAHPTKKSKRRLYAQEELLLEAVHETEPNNARWLLARKRVQDSADQDKDLSLRDKHRGKIIQKYHSRRGCLITLTFPEMDAVPELLTRPNLAPTKPSPAVCVITGKPARYRDPKTQLGYYDSAAFQELKRRHEAGQPLDQRLKPKDKPNNSEGVGKMATSSGKINGSTTPKLVTASMSSSQSATATAAAVPTSSRTINGSTTSKLVTASIPSSQSATAAAAAAVPTSSGTTNGSTTSKLVTASIPSSQSATAAVPISSGTTNGSKTSKLVTASIPSSQSATAAAAAAVPTSSGTTNGSTTSKLVTASISSSQSAAAAAVPTSSGTPNGSTTSKLVTASIPSSQSSTATAAAVPQSAWSQPQSPSVAKVIVVDVQHMSPGGTTIRKSCRKWNPSEKMLQNIVNGPKTEAASGLLRVNPEIASSCNSSGNGSVASAATTVTTCGGAALKKDTKRKAATKISTAASKAKSNHPAHAKKAASGTENGNKGSGHKLPAVKKTNRSVSISISSLSESSPSFESTSFESPPFKSDKIYIMPPDEANGNPEPRRITQSELIMEAIRDYNQSQVERHQTTANRK